LHADVGSPPPGSVCLILRRLLVAWHRCWRWRRLLELGLLVALARLAVAAAHFDIGWGARPGLTLVLTLALGIHDAEIVFRVLIEILRRNPVAARLRFASQRQVALENLISVAADFNVRAVAVESLHPMRQTRSIVMRTATAAPTTATVTTA